MLAIADATAHAHSRGIAHRDLKPSNVLIGSWGETLIADWGLAKRIDAAGQIAANLSGPACTEGSLSDTQSQSFVSAHGVGTRGFRAPEMQTGTAPANLFAVDIYSLGAILACVVTGNAAPTGADTGARSPEHLSLASVLPLIAIAKKAMATEVTDRYATAESLRQDLSNWLAGEPVSAYSESLAERIWKWPGRHRLLAAATASGLLITLVASGLFSWSQFRQKAELRQLLTRTSLLLEENQQAKKSIE